MLAYFALSPDSFYFKFNSNYGIVQVTTRIDKALSGEERSRAQLRHHPHVRYTTLHSGWRIYMEDAHISTSLSDKKNYIFGVFDGHGGAEVSTFVERHFIEELEKNPSYQKK